MSRSAQPAEIHCPIGARAAQLAHLRPDPRTLRNWRNPRSIWPVAHRVRRPLAAALALLCGALLSGCPAPEKKVQGPAAPADEWASLPKSPEWLHATAGFSGDRKAECAEIQKWIDGEAACDASACEHARDLARDWMARCTKLTPDGVDKVKALLPKFEERATQPDSACTTQRKPILAGKCGADPTCEAPAQRWVTRCAGELRSPLGVQILVRSVQRRVSDHDVELDTRSCAELRAEIGQNVACGDRFKCEDAASKIDVYSARCEDEGDRSPLSIALARVVISAAAERKVEPLLAGPDDEGSAAVKGKLPPTVADGSAIVVSVCGARVADADAYFAARKECEAGGEIVLARAFKLQGGFEVRMGRVPAGDTAAFIARYPSLLMAGERERFDRERGAAFDAQLDKAAKLAADPKTQADGAIALYTLFRDHGREILRSDARRAAIKAKDASFAGAFKILGKAKAQLKGPKQELGSIAARAQRFAFSDIDSDASARFGAFSWAALFDTGALLPEAHAAYLKELKGFFVKYAKDLPADEVDADQARAFGVIAEECQANGERARSDERALLDCAFGQRTCDAAQIDALQKSAEKARISAEQGFVAATFFQTTSGPTAAEFYRKVMSTAQCTAPQW
jgi:hypothetical protein